MPVSPGVQNWTIQRRADWVIPLQFIDSTDAPMNLTGWTVKVQAWNVSRSKKYADFTVTYINSVLGLVSVGLTAEQTETFPPEVYYDVLLVNPSGLREYYMEGILYVSEGYTS